MKDKPKTLKEIETCSFPITFDESQTEIEEFFEKEELRKEAIEWVKYYQDVALQKYYEDKTYNWVFYFEREKAVKEIFDISDKELEEENE